MDQSLRISMIGAGNLATPAALAMEAAGHHILDVWSRNPKHARTLTSRLYQALPKNDLDFSESDSDIFLISVPDQALREIADQIILPDREVLLAHTAGSMPMSVLEKGQRVVGVFYPVMTFTRDRKVDFDEVPICIESNTRTGFESLRVLAGSLSNHVVELNSSDRLIMHLAAVFASNFSNHMIRISQELIEREGMDLEILKPLIRETFSKSLATSPEATQTGPAKRNDQDVIRKHLELLNDDPALSLIYKRITEDILKTYQQH